MLGKLDFNQNRVSIIGAGVSGLLVGYRLQQLGFDVHLYEASDRAGGLIQTRHSSYGMIERAAHSLLVNDTVARFFTDLGLKLVPLDPKSKARFIVRDGRPRRMPLTASELFSTIAHAVRKPALRGIPENPTLEQWGQTYLGPAATQYLLGPFVSGIFACSPSDISARTAFPRLIPNSPSLSLLQHFRSLKKQNPKPRAKMMSLQNGLQSLTDALAARLAGRIHFNTPVDSIAGFLSEGNTILSTPAEITARLLENLDPKSSSLLNQVRYSPLITVTAFFDRHAFHPHPPHGVGVLIPRNEPFRILGCLFNSSAFPKRVNSNELVSLTLMLGGTQDPDALLLSESELREIIRDDLGKLLGLKDSPLQLEITKWPRAIPLFDPSLQFAHAALTAGFCSVPGRVVFSNYSAEVSIRGMIESLCQIERP